MFPWYDFLEEISSLSHSIVFLYFFALITEKGFLSLSAILWNSAFKWVYLSFSPLPLPASLIAQLVKNPPVMWETWVLSLGWEHALEKGKAIHSSILAWRIPWTV